ncbi:magnesium transporter [Mycoplasmopsis agassizii]|uniref:Magnesium transporter MgtE n=1 Tax=Mycoplasmopsis agassizii TaxID=33922 RepID=A0A269TIL0_9BACT|nr:magnesium transporter [Mycoplasmopsis agassizii]PAK21284.1 magnesium transporter [Mycoplasmopsis agassizii]
MQYFQDDFNNNDENIGTNIPLTSLGSDEQQSDASTLLAESFSKLVRTRNFNDLRELVNNTPLSKINESILIMKPIIQVLFFRFLLTKQAAEIFQNLDIDVQAQLLTNFADDLSSEIINELKSDEISDLIEELPSEMTAGILAKVKDEEKRKKINEILKFEDDQVGSIMAVDIVSIESNISLKDALRKIKNAYGKNKDLRHYFFVTDDKGKLSGAITLEDLIFNPRNDLVKDHKFQVYAAKTSDSIQESQNLFAKQNMSVIPVVNNFNYLSGILTSESMFDEIELQASEDIYSRASVKVEDVETFEYVSAPVKSIVKSRLFWIVLLLIVATFSQIIIEVFSNVVDQKLGSWVSISILTSLLPILSGAAGNAGSQSSVTISRAAALGELKGIKGKKIVAREVKIGLIIGALLFVVNIIRLSIYFAISGDFVTSRNNTLVIIFVSSLVLFLILVLSKFLGTWLTLVAIFFKKDPAVLSAPLITTILDTISITIFYALIIGLFLALDSAAVQFTIINN